MVGVICLQLHTCSRSFQPHACNLNSVSLADNIKASCGRWIVSVKSYPAVTSSHLYHPPTFIVYTHLCMALTIVSCALVPAVYVCARRFHIETVPKKYNSVYISLAETVWFLKCHTHGPWKSFGLESVEVYTSVLRWITKAPYYLHCRSSNSVVHHNELWKKFQGNQVRQSAICALWKLLYTHDYSWC